MGDQQQAGWRGDSKRDWPGAPREPKAEQVCSESLKILNVGDRGLAEIAWGEVLTCIWAPGIASNSQVVELLAPVTGVGISDPCTEV